MLATLAKHVATEDGKTHAESEKEYQEALNRSKYLLTPIYKFLKERAKGHASVREDDFECPNHYAKLMFRKGKEQEDEALLALLPKNLLD